MSAVDLLLAPAGKAADPFVHALARAAERFDLEPETVALAAEVARWPAGLDLDDRHTITLAVVASWIAVRQGSTRLAVDAKPGAPFVEMLDAVIAQARQESGLAIKGGAWWARALEELLAAGRAGALIGAPGALKPLIFDAPYLYLHRSMVLEDRFVESVVSLARADAPEHDPDALEAALADVAARAPLTDGKPLRPTSDQEDAILRASRPGLTVITGGPGSGKTSILVSVLRVLARRGVAMTDVALVAPTGKAAQRMRQTIEAALEKVAEPAEADQAVKTVAAPGTLHRLLGYSPTTGRFRHHENNRLPHAHVLVDEASMIDLALAERLVRAVRPGASLVLLGDDRQLPAVDAGQPLRDVVRAAERVPSLATRVVRLAHSHRMDASRAHGAAILSASRAVREGVAPEPTLRAAAAEVELEGVEQLPPGAHHLEELLERWYDRFFRASPVWKLAKREYHQRAEGFPKDEVEQLEKLFAHVESFRALCYTHAYDEGTERVNLAFHRRVIADSGLEHAPDFFPGEPVVMLANDYERGVFNGDTGLVLRVSQDGGAQHFMLVFRRAPGFVAFHVGSLRDRIQHAFALTVHKSQGSEHDHVLLVLPVEDFPMNTRELVYTALTRARKSVTIAGAPAVLARGVAREVRRDTGVPARLERALLRSDGSSA